MTSKARWMYFKLRYLDIPKLFAKAYWLKMRRKLAGNRDAAGTFKLNKSFSA